MKTSFSYDWPPVRPATTFVWPISLRFLCRLGALGVLLLCSQLAEAQLIGGRGDGQPTPSEVKPTAVTAGGFSGDVSLFTGTYNTSYLLGTVSTPSGLSYSASLSYSSTFASGDNLPHTSGVPYGEGWTVDLPIISISTETFNKYTLNQLDAFYNCAANTSIDHTAKFNSSAFCEEAVEEGDMHWFAPMLTIPGVASGRMVYKRKEGNEYVFVLHKFERYIEARFRGNSEWEVILDDGTRYIMTAAVVAHSNSSNQRAQDDCSLDVNVQRNVMLPKTAYIKWYCTRIYNRSLVGTIRFQYETFGCMNYYEEFAQPGILHAMHDYLSVGQLEAVPLQAVCKDIIIREIKASNLERLVFDYENIPTTGGVQMLDPNASDVTAVDAMYSSKILEEWQGSQLSAWSRFLHVKSDELSNTKYNGINNLNPYKANITDIGNRYFIGSSTATAKGLAFRHAFLQSPRIGGGQTPNAPSGDTYQIEMEIYDESADISSGRATRPPCLFDVNVATGDAELPLSYIPGTTVPADCHERLTGTSIYSTFNQAVKWSSQNSPDNQYVDPRTSISATFVMPNHPTNYNGFHLQIGAANADIQHSTGTNPMAACGSNPPGTTQPHTDNAYFTEDFPDPDNVCGKPLHSGDPVPGSFGIGIPWYMANNFYNAYNSRLNFLGYDCSMVPSQHFWWNDDSDLSIQWDNIPTLTHHILSTDSDSDPYLFLEKAKLKRIAKNPYMLKAVTKLVFAGGESVQDVMEQGVWHKQSVLNFEYDIEVVKRFVSARIGNTNNVESYCKDYRNIIVLKKIRQMPIEGTLPSLDDAPSTHFEYQNLNYLNAGSCGQGTGTSPSSIYNSNYVVLEKVTDELGREISIEYYPLQEDGEQPTGISGFVSNSYTLFNFIQRFRPSEDDPNPMPSCTSPTPLSPGKSYSFQTYMVVDKIKIKDRQGWKEWDYDFKDFEIYSDDVPMADNWAYDSNSNLTGGFKSATVLGPDNNGVRLKTVSQHYTTDENNMLWGKLYRVDKYDANNDIRETQEIEYDIVMAFEHPGNRFRGTYYDYMEYFFDVAGRPQILGAATYSDGPLQDYYDDVADWGPTVQLPFNFSNPSSPDMAGATSGYEGARSYIFAPKKYSELDPVLQVVEGGMPVYLNSYFIKKVEETNTVHEDNCSPGATGNTSIQTITEYEYYDATYEGLYSSPGFTALSPNIGSRLRWEPSWQLYRTKTYSPHLPNAYTQEEYFYIYDLINVPDYQISPGTDDFDVDHEFALLYDTYAFKRVRGLPFQKRVTTKAANQAPISRSTFYEYRTDWEDHRPEVTIEEVESDVTWPCDGEIVITGGNNEEPDPGPCIIVKGNTPIPDPTTYCQDPVIPYLYCRCNGSPDGTSTPNEYYAEYNGYVSDRENPYDDDVVSAYANTTLLGKIMLHKVKQQMEPGSGVLTFTKVGMTYNPVYPMLTLDMQTILERNEYGQIALEENERGIKTRYDYGDLHFIQYKDCIDGYEALIRIPLNNTPGLPEAIIVGDGRLDKMQTDYVYFPNHTVRSITDPNSTELSYSYDNYGRLHESFRNGSKLQIINYNYWDNVTTGFEARALQNYVETVNYVLSNSNWREKAFVDPLGRSIGMIKDNSILQGNTIYDTWDQPILQLKPSQGNGITPLINFTGTAADHEELQYENAPGGRLLKSSKNGESIAGTHTVDYEYCIVMATALQSALTAAGHTGRVPPGDRFFKNTTTDEDGKLMVEYSNAVGQPVATITSDGTTGSAATTFYYDSQGNLVESVNSHGQSSEYEYNYLGQVYYKSTVDGGEVEYGYDASGLLIGEKDEIIGLRIYKYDDYGRQLLQANNFSLQDFYVIGNDGMYWQTDPNLTVYNNLFTSSQTRLEKRWYYNTFDPALGSLHASGTGPYIFSDITHGIGRVTMTATYDLLGNPVEIRSYSYNADGFMKWEISQFNYLGITTSNRGHVTKIDYPFYDLQGNILWQNIDLNIDGVLDFQNAYNYDSRNRLQAVYANFEARGSSGFRVADYTYYNPTDLLRFRRYYDSFNGTTCKNVEVDETEYRYDSRFRMLSKTSTLYDHYLYYDGNHYLPHTTTQTNNFNGNINTTRSIYNLSAATNDPGNFPLVFAYNYQYDQLNRLTRADAYDGAVGDFGTVDYFYDKIGNLTDLYRWGYNTSGQLARDRYRYTYQPGTNRLTQITELNTNTIDRSITYDGNGNMVTDTKLDIGLTKYGRANLPWEVIKGGYSRTIGYLYDMKDQRIFKRESPGNLPPVIQKVYYLRDASGRELGVYDYLSGELEWFAFGHERIAKIPHHTTDVLSDPGDLGGGGSSRNAQSSNPIIPNPHFYITDHLGNTRVVYTTSVGCDGSNTFKTYTLQYAGNYYPYGKALREFVNGAAERYLTTQHERDVETGLDYRGARFYDADIGRFLSLDPLAMEFPAWSDYNYVLGNPVMLIDPDGRMPKDSDPPVFFQKMGEAAHYIVRVAIPGVVESIAESLNFADTPDGGIIMTATDSPAPGGGETRVYQKDADQIDISEFITSVPPGTQQLQRVSKGTRILDTRLDHDSPLVKAVEIIPDIGNRVVDAGRAMKSQAERIKEKLKPAQEDTVYNGVGDFGPGSGTKTTTYPKQEPESDDNEN